MGFAPGGVLQVGEPFDRSRPGLAPGDGRIEFRYLGAAVPASSPRLPPEDVRVRRGIARSVVAPDVVECRGSVACSRTGVWSARVAEDHPDAGVFNQWFRQAYVEAGRPFPDSRDAHLPIAARDVTWRWWGSANETRGPGLTRIRLDDPADSPPA